MLFQAAASVDAPERPQAALRRQQLAALSIRRVRGTDEELSIEVRGSPRLVCSHEGDLAKAGAVHSQGHIS